MVSGHNFTNTTRSSSSSSLSSSVTVSHRHCHHQTPPPSLLVLSLPLMFIVKSPYFGGKGACRDPSAADATARYCLQLPAGLRAPPSAVPAGGAGASAPRCTTRSRPVGMRGTSLWQRPVTTTSTWPPPPPTRYAASQAQIKALMCCLTYFLKLFLALKNSRKLTGYS